MKIAVASKNAHKVTEMAALLCGDGDFELVTMRDAGLDIEIEENGKTFEENAKIKAREVCRLTGKPAIADDSGLSVDVLGGEPGIYSARYASDGPENAPDAANNAKLLEKLKDIPGPERTARFVSAVALVLPDGRELVVRGEAGGVILSEYAGDGGFGYDPLFYYEPLKKTFAELSPEEKNAVSHRGVAVELFAKALKGIEAAL